MRSFLVAACFGLFWGSFASPANAQEPGGEDKVVGAVWRFEAKESAKKNAKVIESGRFRATLDGKIYNPKGTQVGTYRYTNKAQDRVELRITEGKLKGTSELVKTNIQSPSWQGKWKLEDGSSAHMVIRMIKD